MANTFIDFEDFENKIYGDRPVFIEFYADWCPNCTKNNHLIPDLSKEDNIINNIDIYRCNIEEQEDIADYCDITDLPSYICFQNGVYLFTKEGLNKDTLKRLLNGVLTK